MSRIGNNPISVPAGVEVSYNKNEVLVKGKNGELNLTLKGDIAVEVGEKEVVVKRKNEMKETKSKHGLYRMLIHNMVVGVSEGYKKSLELVGVGYGAKKNGNFLELNLGYSHPIFFEIPAELKFETITEKGKNPTVILEGIDKQLIGLVAAKIKALRKTEPYKGKGIRFTGEVIRRKAGKAAAK